MDNRRTKKQISNNPNAPKKNLTKTRNKNNNKDIDLIDSLLNGNKNDNKIQNNNKKTQAYNRKNKDFNINQILNNPTSTKKMTGGRNSKPIQKQTKSKKEKIINNFHQAINSTKSDQVIVKMLELNETDIINFYSNLEKLIGQELSLDIRKNMSEDLKANKKNLKNEGSFALCPFCRENKSNCVILLCGHLICHKCGKNINRCKYPCPKCKKPIKYIQYIVD